jgi:hypothetical protein
MLSKSSGFANLCARRLCANPRRVAKLPFAATHEHGPPARNAFDHTVGAMPRAAKAVPRSRVLTPDLPEVTPLACAPCSPRRTSWFTSRQPQPLGQGGAAKRSCVPVKPSRKVPKPLSNQLESGEACSPACEGIGTVSCVEMRHKVAALLQDPGKTGAAAPDQQTATFSADGPTSLPIRTVR